MDGGLKWRWSAAADPDKQYLALATYLELKSGWGLPRFEWHSLRVHRQMSRSPGLIGFSFNGRFPKRYWTVSVWEDGRSLGEFIRTDAHSDAMKATTPLMAKFNTVRWKIDGGDTPPTWQEAFARLDDGDAP